MRKSNRLNFVNSLANLLLPTGGVALLICVLPDTAGAKAVASHSFRGTTAYAATERAVSFGERPSGSDAIQKLRAWIASEIKPTGAEISLDSFTGQTPAGPVAMANIIAKFPGTSGKAIVVSGHYDTKRIPMMNFVGANDAASSTGFLIELARVVPGLKHADDIYLVFFDGEEAVRADWGDDDHTYGSRHLAAKWSADGTTSRIKALINVDMIGDKNLDISDDQNSSESLRKLMWQQAEKLGDAKYFRHDAGAIEDDHNPFADAGVNVLDVIDLDYGPNGSYWHTAQDTMDKLSAHSFQVVGDVVVGMLRDLER